MYICIYQNVIIPQYILFPFCHREKCTFHLLFRPLIPFPDVVILIICEHQLTTGVHCAIHSPLNALLKNIAGRSVTILFNVAKKMKK